MRKTNVKDLDIFQLIGIKGEIVNLMEHYGQIIPDYALLLSSDGQMTPPQQEMYKKYMHLQSKLNKINNIIEKYILEDLNVHETE